MRSSTADLPARAPVAAPGAGPCQSALERARDLGLQLVSSPPANDDVPVPVSDVAAAANVLELDQPTRQALRIAAVTWLRDLADSTPTSA